MSLIPARRDRHDSARWQGVVRGEPRRTDGHRGELAAELVVVPVGGDGRFGGAPVRAAPYPEAWALEAHAPSRDAETAAFRAAVPLSSTPQRRNWRGTAYDAPDTRRLVVAKRFSSTRIPPP